MYTNMEYQDNYDRKTSYNPVLLKKDINNYFEESYNDFVNESPLRMYISIDDRNYRELKIEEGIKATMNIAISGIMEKINYEKNFFEQKRDIKERVIKELNFYSQLTHLMWTKDNALEVMVEKFLLIFYEKITPRLQNNITKLEKKEKYFINTDLLYQMG